MQDTALDENDSRGANTDDGAGGSVAAAANDDAAIDIHQSANHQSCPDVGISTAPADNPVNPTAPPAESDDNPATMSACTDHSAANPPEG